MLEEQGHGLVRVHILGVPENRGDSSVLGVPFVPGFTHSVLLFNALDLVLVAILLVPAGAARRVNHRLPATPARIQLPAMAGAEEEMD